MSDKKKANITGLWKSEFGLSGTITVEKLKEALNAIGFRELAPNTKLYFNVNEKKKEWVKKPTDSTHTLSVGTPRDVEDSSGDW